VKVNFVCSGAAAICMDLGHLTLKRGISHNLEGEELNAPKDAKVKFFIFTFIFSKILSNRILTTFENYLTLNLN
jgi:hypothetical protein